MRSVLLMTLNETIIVEVKTKRQIFFLIFENDHSKVRILVYSRLENQRIWPLVVTATIGCHECKHE